MKKGLSLPLEMIVIIAIAVLVLVVVAAVFSGAISGGDRTMRIARAFDDGCSKLRSVYNCDISRLGDIKIRVDNKIDTGDTLTANSEYSMSQICVKKGLGTTAMTGSTTKSECSVACGC